MTNETELEILVEDDPATPPPSDDTPAGAAKPSTADGGAVDPKEGIDKLKADLEESRNETATAKARASEAERRAMAAASEAASRTKEVNESNMALVTNAIETLEMANASAKAAYAAALAAGDHVQAADLNDQMVENHGKLLQLRSGKAHLEEEAKRPPPKPVVETQDDPVEFIAGQLTAKSADWVRKHPEYARDKNLWDRVVAADQLARTFGHAADSPEYFAHVEKTLGVDPVDSGRTTDQDPKPAGRQPAPPAAPGGGQRPPGEEGPRRQVVRLTPQEVEMAENMGMTPQEYAKNKVALQKEGKLG